METWHGLHSQRSRRHSFGQGSAHEGIFIQGWPRVDLNWLSLAALTAALKAPKAAPVVALRNHTGSKQTSATTCTNIIINVWADISKTPATTAEARAQVLKALQEDVLPRVSAENSVTLGSPEVTTQEVLAALRKSSLHRAARPDGIEFLNSKKASKSISRPYSRECSQLSVD